MKMLTIPVKGFWVLCNADSDLNEEFGAADGDSPASQRSGSERKME